MYFVIEIGTTLIKRFRLANKLTFYLITCSWYTIAFQKLGISENHLVFSIHLHTCSHIHITVSMCYV